METARKGKVYLVGAGPGDPALMTVRARELIDSADAIVYHSRALTPLLPPGAKERGYPEIYFVGEDRQGRRPSRDSVNGLLSTLARSGKNVVRLTRGDPFFLNRGSEEAQHLNDCAIEFEIVPGIPEAVAAAAHAGIPLSHSDMSTTVVFIDSRTFRDRGAGQVTSASATETIVIGPGSDVLDAITKELLDRGMSPDIPAATIQFPGTSRQRVVSGQLDSIARLVGEAGITGRAVTIIGYTVVLEFELGWLVRRPLFGRRVALAEPPSASGQLGSMLRDLGADVTDMPEAESQRMHVEWNRDVIDALDETQWLIFSGTDAVAIFWEKLLGSGRDARALASHKIAAIGAPTVRAVLERGIAVDVAPSRFDADSIAAELTLRDDVGGARALLITSEGVDDVIVSAFEAAGGAVDAINTSRRVIDERAMNRWKERLASHRPDAVAFTSPRSVRRFSEAAGDESGWRSVSIGGATSQLLRSTGVDITSEADEPTLAAVVEAVRRALE